MKLKNRKKIKKHTTKNKFKKKTHVNSPYPCLTTIDQTHNQHTTHIFNTQKCTRSGEGTGAGGGALMKTTLCKGTITMPRNITKIP